VTGQDPTERAQDDAAKGIAEIERRIEDLAEQIGCLIATGPAADREALHDYAVSLVREKLPLADPSFAVPGAPRGDAAEEYPSNTASLLGYGVLLIPVGFLMLLVFAPLGALLLSAGVAMAVTGIVLALVGKVRQT
jgi:hypothetical protein